MKKPRHHLIDRLIPLKTRDLSFRIASEKYSFEDEIFDYADRIARVIAFMLYFSIRHPEFSVPYDYIQACIKSLQSHSIDQNLFASDYVVFVNQNHLHHVLTEDDPIDLSDVAQLELDVEIVGNYLLDNPEWMHGTSLILKEDDTR